MSLRTECGFVRVGVASLGHGYEGDRSRVVRRLADRCLEGKDVHLPTQSDAQSSRGISLSLISSRKHFSSKLMLVIKKTTVAEQDGDHCSDRCGRGDEEHDNDLIVDRVER